MSLFRPEALEAKKLNSFGRTVPLYPTHSLPLVVLLCAIVGALLLWVTQGSYARTEVVQGWVVPSGQMARITATRTGVLSEFYVKEGDMVEKGQKLALITLQNANSSAVDPSAQSEGLINQQRQLLADQAKLARSTASAEISRLDQSIDELQVQVNSIDAQIALQRQQVASAEASFAIMQDAQKKNYVSKVEFENQKRAMLTERTNLEGLISQRSGLRAQIQAAEADKRRARNDMNARLTELQNTDVMLTEKQVAVANERNIVLTAPISGRVSALQAKIGETVGGPQPMFFLLGEGAKLRVELFAPSRAMGFVARGQEVRLMYDAFPYQQYGSHLGKVADISAVAIPPSEIAAPLKLEDSVYRLQVDLDAQSVAARGSQFPLQPGMTLSANLVLERQSFLDWLLEPINGVRTRV